MKFYKINNKKRLKTIINILSREYSHAKIALNFETEFQLLLAVILSAQCTDKRVNMVTPVLFKKYPKVEDLANAELKDLESIVFSTGFYRNKAKNIRGAARGILKDFGGKLPHKMEDLLTLPG